MIRPTGNSCDQNWAQSTLFEPLNSFKAATVTNQTPQTPPPAAARRPPENDDDTMNNDR